VSGRKHGRTCLPEHLVISQAEGHPLVASDMGTLAHELPQLDLTVDGLPSRDHADPCVDLRKQIRQVEILALAHPHRLYWPPDDADNEPWTISTLGRSLGPDGWLSPLQATRVTAFSSTA